jgi:hypothetical protein
MEKEMKTERERETETETERPRLHRKQEKVNIIITRKGDKKRIPIILLHKNEQFIEILSI